MRGSGSVKPSPLQSAQCVLDVIIREPVPVKEGEVEESEKGQNAGCIVQGVRQGAKQEMES